MDRTYRLNGTTQSTLRNLSAIMRRQALAEEKADHFINPEWVEWLMGFPPGWTDVVSAP